LRRAAVRGRLLRLIAVLALAALTAGPARAAGPIQLDAAVDRDQVTIDQRIRLTLQIEVPDGARITWPELPPRLAGFAVVEAAALDLPAEATHLAYAWLLEPERIGILTLPPLAVRVQEAGAGPAGMREVQSPPVTVTVVSILPEDVDLALHKDIAPPVTLRASGGGFLLWAALAALAGGLALLAVRRLRPRWARRASAPAPGLRAAHLVALDELDSLQQLHPADERGIEDYYLRLSAILRRYVERRFELEALSRTTEEVVADARASTEELRAQGERIGALLGPCDLVKFARRRPDDGEMSTALARARVFVTSTGDERRLVAIERGEAAP
jgi:hypothetical protein